MTHYLTKYMQRIALIVALLIANAIHANYNLYVYATDVNNGKVNVINEATNTVVTSITLPLPSGAFGANPYALAAAPDSSTVCVGNGNPDQFGHYQPTVTIIDATLAIPTIIETTAALTGSSAATFYPNAIAYTTDSNTIYVGLGSGDIYPISNIKGPGAPIIGYPILTDGSPIYGIVIADTYNGETAYIVTNGGTIYYMSTTDNIPHIMQSTTLLEFFGVTITPDDLYVIAVATAGSTSMGYNIYSTISNTFIGGAAITSFEAFPGGITNDGVNLYVPDNLTGNLYSFPIGTSLPSPTFSVTTDPAAIAITPDYSTLYIPSGFGGGIHSYTLPSGTPTANPVTGTSSRSNSIAITPNAGIQPPPPPPVSIMPPTSVSGCKTSNKFLMQADYINNITWTAPTSGNAPVSYNIYRDPMLTQLVANVPASGTLQYYDHGRNPNVTDSYYIVSVDASGNQSTAASVTVTQNC